MRRSCPCAVVWDGAAEHQVVCGAPNVARRTAGRRLRGSARALPGGLKIDRSKLRGVESNGMLCSAAELGIGDDADGIMELHGDYRPGDSLRDALQLDDVSDRHRADAESRRLSEHSRHRARDRCAVPDCASARRTARRSTATVGDTFPVRLEDGAGCPRYLGRVIRGVNPAARDADVDEANACAARGCARSIRSSTSRTT